jgi:elongation factor P--(R)-beta-lysine ligase
MLIAAAELNRILRARSNAEHRVRRYFADHGFLEVHTPTRVRAPGTDVYIDPIPSEDHWLITSPEFHLKQLLAAGMTHIFEFARCFRREELGPWHQPEFTLLEWYRAQAEVLQVMADTEQLVQSVSELIADGQLKRDDKTVRVEPPFQRLTVSDAFHEFAGIADAVELAAEQESLYFQLWVDRVEPMLCAMSAPLFVVEYPLTQAALAQPCAHNPRVAERFELFALGVELCNGYGELTDPREQRARFENDNKKRQLSGKPELPIDEAFLGALEGGMPPAAGNALGFERLLALCLGTTLDRVLPFPAR